MNIQLKQKVSTVTLWGMIIIFLLMAGLYLVKLLEKVYGLSVFTSKSSIFLNMTSGIAIGFFICLALLSIAINVSAIADSQRKETIEPTDRLKVLKITLLIISIIVGLNIFMFAGNYLSEKKWKTTLIKEQQDIVKRYAKTIDIITDSLENDKNAERIPERLKFLSRLKQEFPNVFLIGYTEFDGQIVFFRIHGYMDLRYPNGNPIESQFYEASEQEVEYFMDLYNNNKLEKKIIRNRNDYIFYYPVMGKKKKYILVFSKRTHHGKIGK